MEKSNIAIGQMFIQFPQPISDNQEKPMPRVWVKVANKVLGHHYGEDKEEVSLFVDNNALVQSSINPNYCIGIRDKWNITDRYYGECVRKGMFVPITDLREADGVCDEIGWPKYEVDLGF